MCFILVENLREKNILLDAKYLLNEKKNVTYSAYGETDLSLERTYARETSLKELVVQGEESDTVTNNA